LDCISLFAPALIQIQRLDLFPCSRDPAEPIEVSMKKRVSLLLIAVLTITVSLAFASGFRNLRANLSGFNETPAAISTGASGNFVARINDNDTITWALSYSALEGAVQQAHIHLGRRGTTGGISVFLCTNLGNGPAGTQACPAPPAMISGTITTADVSPNIPATAGARAQGLDTGQFDELVRAIRAGATYANVHSATWPSGEIRDQIRHSEGHGHD
jgi:CHRD domain